MALNTLSSNIKYYRLKAGMSQTQTAKSAEMNRSAYIMLENGESEPRSSTLLKIAHALGVNLSALFEEPLKVSGIRFRTNKSKNKGEENTRLSDIRNFLRWLNNYTFLENILQIKKPNQLNDNIIDEITGIKGIKERAEYTRKAAGLNNKEPINDIISKLESLGIKIYLKKLFIKNCFGFSLSDENLGKAIAINVDESITIERQVFTAAHELGHLILHRSSYDIRNKEEEKKQEEEANIFAGHFLMPDQGFRNKLKEYSGLNFIEIVLKIKRFYKVSYITVLKRIVDDGLAESSIYREFAIQYKQLYKKNLRDHYEPDSLRDNKNPYSSDIEPETLSAVEFFDDGLKTKVFEAYTKELITISKAAEILGITLSELKEIVNNWNLLYHDKIV
jgi:Zn-dependent peptidase ImmA (M78 family)/transcriptional regulator with XRE-family HTH domain